MAKVILHGKKYTISIQQLTEVLSVQIGAFEKFCKGCPKLKDIVTEFQTMKLKGIGSIQDMQSLAGMPDAVKKQYKKKVKAMDADNRVVEAEYTEE